MAINYWLIKSEPSDYSFEDLKGEDDSIAEWDGVRNYQARNLLRDEIKSGDRVIYYHSNSKPSGAVGTAFIVKNGYPDHTAWDPESEHPDPKSTPSKPIWFMVDIQAELELPNIVTLAKIKSTPTLAECSLFKRPRLSVHPITKIEWEIITKIGGVS